MPSSRRYAVPPEFRKLIEDAQSGLGISLRDLARDTGIPVSTLSRILRGERKIPKNEDVIKIAKTLRLNPKELLIAAGRIPDEPHLEVLFRTAGQLSPEDLKAVKEFAARLMKKHRDKGSRTR
jgi:transcriptional regulator with XRE-family HTH domain